MDSTKTHYIPPYILLCPLIAVMATLLVMPTGAQDAPPWTMHEAF